MKNIILLISIFLSFNGFGQLINNLDFKNGIAKFKTGDDISKYKNYLTPVTTRFNTSNLQVYKYTKGDVTHIYGVDINQINLFFCKNKLQMIQLELGLGVEKSAQFTESEFKLLKNKFINNFGVFQKEQSVNNEEDTGGILLWDASIIRLELIWLKNYQDQFYGGYILLKNKNIEHKCNLSDF